jgi:hypothetical protein
VVVHHKFIDSSTAFARGQKLILNEDAPTGVVGLQFYPRPGRLTWRVRPLARAGWPDSDQIKG